MHTIEHVGQLIKFSEKNPKVIASDLDHTLIDFDAGHDAGLKAIAAITDEKFAARVDEIFQFLVIGNRTSIHDEWLDREKHDELLASLIPHQKHDIEKFGNRKFSRETWIMIAAIELGYKPTKEFITKVRETYWDAVAKYALLFPEAPEFFKWIQKEGIALLVMTGSDSVVNVEGDEEAELVYEPQASWDYKLKRMSNIPSQAVMIGDPADKPFQPFFDRVYAEAILLGAQSPDDVWFVGDSKGSDLDIPEKDGYETFLVKRPKKV